MSDDEIKMAFQRIPFEERKQHFSYLNEILRKLSVINHSTKPDKSKFLEVPRDYEEYIKSMTTIMFSAGSERPYTVTWSDVKYLDHLEWVLSHLNHHDYAHILQTWLNLNSVIAEYNQMVTKSISKITQIIRTHMNRDYPGFSEEPNTDADGFYLSNIFRVLFENYHYYIIGSKRTDFDLEIVTWNNSNSFQANLVERQSLGGGAYGINRIAFIESTSKEKLDINKLKLTLISICEDQELVKQFCILNDKIAEIDNIRLQFRNQLKSLIKDIEAGAIMKGTCILGY